MNYDDLLNRIEEEAGAAPVSGPGSGIPALGSAGTTTEDNIAYLPSQKKVVRPVCPGRKKRCKDVKVKEDEVGLPELQQKLLDEVGPAKKSDMMKAAASTEEPFVKFWLLSDGTFMPMPKGHLYNMRWSEYEDLKKSGAIRISSDPGKEMALDYNGVPNSDQVIALQFLSALHNTTRVVIEDEENTSNALSKRGDMVELKSPRDLSRILRRQGRQKSLASQFHEAKNSLPDEQQEVLDMFGPATDSELNKVSKFPGEGDYVKLWLLNDGSFVFVSYAHADVVRDALGYEDEEEDVSELMSDFVSTGAIRISVFPSVEMLLDYDDKPTMAQMKALVDLANRHEIRKVILEDSGREVKLNKPSSIRNVFKGGGDSLAAQFHESLEEAMREDMTKLREDLKPSLTKLFEGDPFHWIERDALLWKSRFGVDQYLTAGAPLVSIEKKVRDLQKLSGTLLQKYGNDRGYLEMLIDAMEEREPLNSFEGFKSNDYLYGTRMRSSHEGIEMVFEAALDPLYNVSETVYVGDTDVLDRWEELAGGIKRVGNVVYPKGERFTPGLLQLLEHAIIDSIDVEDEAEEEME